MLGITKCVGVYPRARRGPSIVSSTYLLAALCVDYSPGAWSVMPPQP
jgi:hypothetical protein